MENGTTNVLTNGADSEEKSQVQTSTRQKKCTDPIMFSLLELKKNFR